MNTQTITPAAATVPYFALLNEFINSQSSIIKYVRIVYFCI